MDGTLMDDALKALIGDAGMTQITLGMSNASVYRIEGDQQRYLKTAPAGDAELYAEKARLEWLQGQLPVPRVLYFGADESQTYLLITEIPGIPASDGVFAAEPEKVIPLLALGLRTIHQVKDCPFDQRLDVKLAQAKQRTEAGLVAVDNFDEDRQGMTPASLYEQLVATRPALEDVVFTHGDYCLENIIIENNPRLMYLRGFIDWGRCGLADRYQDLALAAREIGERFGVEGVNLFFKAYEGDTLSGISPHDPRIAYYQLMDEFF